ncbi:hypothetical protein ACIO6U_03030 [Streptomyces sp. NPDC087422]|uniref:hypothetical protein n=1 Tax=Streptomyces sp. NPDC087422 TaxID=3365786 RepID=UPI00381C7978
MTGPEHYTEAERLIAGRHFPADPDLGDPASYHPATADDIAQAQVHAILALAAATALAASPAGHMPIADYNAWRATAHAPDVRTSAYDAETAGA